MKLQFFETDQGDLYLDDEGGGIDPEVRDWAGQNGIRFARKSSFSVVFESPAFRGLEEARAWFEENIEEDAGGEEDWEEDIPGDYSEWGGSFEGRKVSPDRFMASEAWAAADEEGGSVLGFWLPPGTCFTLFPPRGANGEPDVFVVVFLDVEDMVVQGVYDSVWLRDEWDEFHPMEDGLSREDVAYARSLIETILDPRQGAL